MLVIMQDKDKVVQSRHINPENYDSERMEIVKEDE